MEHVMYLVIHDAVSFVVDMRNYYILDNFPEGSVQLGIHLLHWERSQYNCFHESFYLLDASQTHKIVSVLKKSGSG